MGNKGDSKPHLEQDRRSIGGLTGWLLGLLARRTSRRARPRLALIERIALAPRQSLALIEAEGRRILVATSADGASAFLPLGDAAQPAAQTRTLERQAEAAPQSSPARLHAVRRPKPLAVPAQRASRLRVSR